MNKEKRRSLIFILSLIFLFSCFYNIRSDISIKAMYSNGPTFNGVSDITIERGSDFDILEGVTANSSLYGDLTAKISVHGKIDNKITGEYIIRYSVTDKDNNVSEAIRRINVIDYKKTEITGNETFFSVYGKDSNSPDFKITFDKNKKILQVLDKRDVDNLSNDFLHLQYFKFFLYDKDGNNKSSVTLLGSDKGNSIKLNDIDKVPFEYGDYIKFFVQNDETIKLGGDLTGVRPYYLRYKDLKFNITVDGLKVEDTASGIAVNIQFFNNRIINKGELFNPLENVVATNEYEEDYTDKIKVSGDVNTNISGKYTLKYTIVDGERSSPPFFRTIIVENKITEEKRNKLRNIEGNYPTLKLINHNSYFRSIDRKVNKFIINFEKERGIDKHGRRIKR